MNKTVFYTAMVTALASVTAPVHADDSTIVVGDVVVRAQATGGLNTRNILTSVDVLAGEKLQDKSVASTWELLGLMPGVQLTEFRMGAESGKPTFRAFNGEGYINGIKVLIDGVPSNVNSGNQRFIDMLPPLELEYIEVVRGTNDPRYGLHNIGGNINLVTRQGGNYTKGRLTYGSFATREAQLVLGREADGLAQNYYVSRQLSNGHRPHAESDKTSLGGKWFYTVAGTGLRLGAVLRHHRNESQEPGYLTAAEFAADRLQTTGRHVNDGSDRDLSQASAVAEWQVNDQVFWRNTLYFNEYSDDRRFTVSPVVRDRRIWNEHHRGLLSTVTWRVDERLTLEGGFNVEEQDNRFFSRRWRDNSPTNASTPTDFNSTPTQVRNDDVYSLNNLGAYVQAVIEPTATLKIVPAWRVDKFSGQTHLRNLGTRAALQDYGWIHQPKLSVVYSPTKVASVYANWGQTFQALTGSRGPAYLTAGTPAYDASINTGTELGVKFKPLPGTEARVAVWRQDATDEVANMPSIDSTTGLGETRRQGVDLQVSSRVNERFMVWASHAIQEARVTSATATGGVSLVGKEVSHTPRYISNLGVDFRPSGTWQWGLQVRAQGDHYIDDLNAQRKLGRYVLLDASARYQLTPSVSVGLQLKNITDRQYEYAWDNGGTPMLSAAPGRSGFVSLNVSL